MDGSLAPIDRTSPFAVAGAVKPAQESEKEKERKKFSEELEDEIDEDAKKKHKHDTLTIGETDCVPEQHEAGDVPEDIPAPVAQHIDLKA